MPTEMAFTGVEGKDQVYITLFQKLKYFSDRLEHDPQNDFYKNLIRDIEKEIAADKVKGESGTSYKEWDVVRSGRPRVLGDECSIRWGHVTVYRPITLSHYSRDGVPVEVVSTRELKLRLPS